MLQRVNEALFPYIPANMFVTCFYATLEPESGLLRYANAGHDLPFLHHGGEAKVLRARGMPLGLMSSMGHEEMELVLEAGESVLFYSDLIRGASSCRRGKSPLGSADRTRCIRSSSKSPGFPSSSRAYINE